MAGIASGIYGDQSKVYNDSFTSSARIEALLLEGEDYNIPRLPATAADGQQIRIFGTNGTIVSPGDLSFMYSSTGVLYTNTTGGTISGGQLDVKILCEVQGQIGNITAPDTLRIISPPTGVLLSANIIVSVADGADIESIDSYRARLLSRKQNPPAGGNQADYPLFAFSADPSVRSATIKDLAVGLGTVDIYITTGTTDIDSARNERSFYC